MSRPVLYVLAGVNGAGKSSIGGHLLTNAGLTWFNPDTFARELIATTGCDQETANGLAWTEGVRRLDDAVANLRSYAFETTLGGRTITAKLQAAARTHDVIIWFCGLDSPDRHLRRVQARVAEGGHAIPETTIRARYPRALQNLIALMPHLAHLRVYDNSADAAPGEPIPDPVSVLELADGKPLQPAAHDAAALGRTPEWAKALVEAALRLTAR
jgi:predicted ABC-type ATPase